MEGPRPINPVRVPSARAIVAGERLLASLSIEDPSEIDIALIASHCGAFVVGRAPANQEDHVVTRGKTALIALAEATFRSAKWRFVVAHEIGHYLLHPDLDGFAHCTAGVGSSNALPKGARVLEREANDFASALLMPRAFFELLRDGRPLSLEVVRELARGFDTSLSTTALRWIELATDPCAAVLSAAGRIVRYSPTTSFGVRFRPRQRVLAGTRAAALMSGEEGDGVAVSVARRLWSADREAAAGGDLVEQSMRLGDLDAVLTLLWHA